MTRLHPGKWATSSSSATEAPELTAERQEAAAMLPVGLVQDDEIIILQVRPSVLFVLLSSVGSLAAIAVVTLTAALLTIRLPWIPLTELQVYTLGVVVASARLLWQCLDWWGRVYVLTDRRVLCRAGVLRATVFEAPLRNIQHTSVFQPLRERLLGLGSIGFSTAGSHVFDAFWVTIRQPIAMHRIVVETLQRYGRH